MNILFVKKLLSPVGGSEALTFHLSARLAARGHRVRVVCLWPRRERYGFPPPTCLSSVNDTHRLFLHAGVEICQLKPHGGLVGQWLDVLPPFNLLRYEVARELARGFDVIHNVCREYADASIRLADEVGAVLVSTPLAHPRQPWGGGDDSDVRCYRRADAVIALTQVEREWYLARGVPAARVHVVGLAPTTAGDGDPDSFRDRYGIHGPIILFLGRKERYKGVDALLEASNLVWAQHPSAHFVFLGEASFRQRYADPFRAHRDRRIINLPVVDEPTRDGALAACEMLCLPSGHETFGLVLLEAWAHRKPVVVNDTPALREVVAHGVDGLVASRRPAELAAAINRLLDDPELARAMGREGRRKVDRRFNWECQVGLTERIYADLLASAR